MPTRDRHSGWKDTLQIYRSGQIENAISASKVVGPGQAPVALGGVERSRRMTQQGRGIRRVNVERSDRPLSDSDRRKVVVGSTRGARRNFDAIDHAEEELKSVDLSPTELRVLHLMRLGKTTKAIAEMLQIPERMVELHVRHGLRRLRARSGEELLSLIGKCH